MIRSSSLDIKTERQREEHNKETPGPMRGCAIQLSYFNHFSCILVSCFTCKK